jgi:SAM-dependent methyltransferase
MTDPVTSVLTNAVQGNQDQSIFPRSPRLDFFDVMLGKPDWETSKVLDIGGINKNKINPENYYCLDVDKDAVEYGRSNFPTANWYQHTAFNHMYNVVGMEGVSFPYPDNTFDCVVAYSVYSHTTFEQLCFDLAEIQRVCKPGGKVAITIIDKESAEYFTKKRISDYPGKHCLTHNDILLEPILDFKYFVDNDLLVDKLHNTESVNHLVTIYNTDWLIEHFNDQLNLTLKYPLAGHVQKTLVFDNE